MLPHNAAYAVESCMHQRIGGSKCGISCDQYIYTYALAAAAAAYALDKCAHKDIERAVPIYETLVLSA